MAKKKKFFLLGCICHFKKVSTILQNDIIRNEKSFWKITLNFFVSLFHPSLFSNFGHLAATTWTAHAASAHTAPTATAYVQCTCQQHLQHILYIHSITINGHCTCQQHSIRHNTVTSHVNIARRIHIRSISNYSNSTRSVASVYSNNSNITFHLHMSSTHMIGLCRIRDHVIRIYICRLALCHIWV